MGVSEPEAPPHGPPSCTDARHVVRRYRLLMVGSDAGAKRTRLLQARVLFVMSQIASGTAPAAKGGLSTDAVSVSADGVLDSIPHRRLTRLVHSARCRPRLLNLAAYYFGGIPPVPCASAGLVSHAYASDNMRMHRALCACALILSLAFEVGA